MDAREKIVRAILWTIASAVVLMIAAGFLIPVINPPPKTYRFLFPAGTRRTLDMRESAFLLRTMGPGAPLLPREDGFRLVRFDRAKSIDTSEEYVFGNEYFREEIYIVSTDGRREEADRIWCTPAPSLQHVPAVVTCNAR